MTRYAFSNAISGYLEFATENARNILPSHLEPVELHHGTSVLSIAVFDFTDTPVGPYGELVLSVVVAPLLKRGERLPKAAFYPFQVATTSPASREHAIARWRLPHWMEDVQTSFSQEGRSITARVAADGELLAELTISEHSWQAVSHLYQTFMGDGDDSYMALITVEGTQSEHEEETGRLVLGDHPFNKDLMIDEIYEVPFRELWMRDGVQSFEALVQLETA